MTTGKSIAIECARIAEARRADRIVILDVGRDVLITDYFVICSAPSEKRCRGIAEEIQHEMKSRGVVRLGVEGYREGRWILLDYDEVVVHVFLEEARQYYDLEILWGNASRVDWSVGASPPAPIP